MSLRFGVLGHPVAHSLSPAMHTAAFSELRIDATYERFDVAPTNLGAFMQRVRTENIAGLSVTIPHKVAIMEYLDEIKEDAQKVGAVNTVFWEREKLVGSNTDWIGILMALEAKLSGKSTFHGTYEALVNAKESLIGKKIIILGGAGGAARAAVAAVSNEAKEVTVLARDLKNLNVYKNSIKRGLLSELGEYDCDILINTTPVGMKGKSENESPVPAEYFKNHQPLVFDIIYTPKETKLLRDAREAGCAMLNGVEMFVWQGVWQQSIWGKNQEVSSEMMKKMREAVLEAL